VQVADIDAMLSEGIPFETIEERIETALLPVEIKGLFWVYALVYACDHDRVMGDLFAIHGLACRS
jgi:hypothetical protein